MSHLYTQFSALFICRIPRSIVNYSLVTVCDIFIRTKATVCACSRMASEHGFKHGDKHGIFFRKPIVILVHEHFFFFRYTFRTQ